MSFETLLTLAVAVGLLVLGAVLRLVFMGSVGLFRTIRGDSGRPSRSRTVAPRSWPERGKRILDLGTGTATLEPSDDLAAETAASAA